MHFFLLESCLFGSHPSPNMVFKHCNIKNRDKFIHIEMSCVQSNVNVDVENGVLNNGCQVMGNIFEIESALFGIQCVMMHSPKWVNRIQI